jgi:hypothetical protein
MSRKFVSAILESGRVTKAEAYELLRDACDTWRLDALLFSPVV